MLLLTCALPWLTSIPLVSVTAIFEKAASSVSVNVSVTSWGAALMVEAAAGLERVRAAWARAATLNIRKKKDRAIMEVAGCVLFMALPNIVSLKCPPWTDQPAYSEEHVNG